MPATPANITVDFISNYTGPHRVCYRIGNVGPYTCFTVNCLGGGAACSYVIPISVDNETCPAVSFEGYVQPSCIDILSTSERVAFTYTFNPTPACLKYTVDCLNAPVASFVVTNPGSGYIPAAPPLIVVSGSATAVAVVGTGFILTQIIPSFIGGGSGYVDGVYLNVPLLGGTGAGALGTFSVVGGIVVSGEVTTPGNGYLDGEVLSPNPAFMGPSVPITTATFAITSDYGTITQLNVVTPGSGYTTPPSVTIPPSGGIPALGGAVLEPCPVINATGCSGLGGIIPNILQVGDSVELCKVGVAPVLSAQFGVNLNGNCACSCLTVTLGVTGLGGTIGYTYNDCNGAFVEGTLNLGDPAIVTCVVAGSLLAFNLSGDAAPSIAYGASCP